MTTKNTDNIFNENFNEINERKLMIGMTMNGDGDLLHLSEGISSSIDWLGGIGDE